MEFVGRFDTASEQSRTICAETCRALIPLCKTARLDAISDVHNDSVDAIMERVDRVEDPGGTKRWLTQVRLDLNDPQHANLAIEAAPYTISMALYDANELTVAYISDSGSSLYVTDNGAPEQLLRTHLAHLNEDFDEWFTEKPPTRLDRIKQRMGSWFPPRK